MRTLIAVAWPYASGPRHLGHLAGAYLPADVVARYHRLAGDDVLMVSGSDCHGTPITVAAERAGAAPSDFAAAQHQGIAASFERVGISFDVFTSTTTENHRRVVHDLFGRLHANGFITEGTERTAFCPDEQRTLPDRYVEGACPHCGAPDARGDQCDACGRTLDHEELVEPRCVRCGATADFRELRQLFLRLDLLEPQIAEYLEGQRGWRPFVHAEASGWIRSGLKPRSITRDLDWGVPVPLDGWEDRRLYVWFEAVIGYLSASVEAAPDRWREWWEDPEALHRYFIGKDNGPFHAVWWPAILLGAGGGLHLPDDLVANHYLTEGGAQMSASRGHGFSVDAGIEALGVDPLRHALCALNPETGDVAFDRDQVDDLTRTGLLGCIANPVHRVATLAWKRFDGRPDGAAWAAERDAAARALDGVGEALRGAGIREAVRRLHDLGRTINRRLAETEPWTLPDADAHGELSRLLAWCDAVGVGAWPIVPGVAERIRTTLGRDPSPDAWRIAPEPPRIAGSPEPPLAT